VQQQNGLTLAPALTHTRASDSPLRNRMIDEGVLRPARNTALAPDPRDRLFVAHVPRWVPVFRLVDESRWS
jgi:hypothetical protein